MGPGRAAASRRHGVAVFHAVVTRRGFLLSRARSHIKYSSPNGATHARARPSFNFCNILILFYALTKRRRRRQRTIERTHNAHNARCSVPPLCLCWAVHVSVRARRTVLHHVRCGPPTQYPPHPPHQSTRVEWRACSSHPQPLNPKNDER